MKTPWADGPRELLQHAVDHLSLGGDFDRRIAMVSIDNSVELTVKTFLGLPKRTRNCSGPTRKELVSASESFPALLSLLETHASNLIFGISLDEIEWYHRIRNQLYHSGNGITVEKTLVETYFVLASTLFENLFGISPELSHTNAISTKTSEFLGMWVDFQRQLKMKFPKIKNGAVLFTLRYRLLNKVSPDGEELYKAVANFRNDLVHVRREFAVRELDDYMEQLSKLISLTKKIPNKRVESSC